MTKASEYLEKTGSTKDITLPSGQVFTIRKVTGRMLMKAGIKIPLVSGTETSTSAEKSKILWEKMTDEQRADAVRFNDALVCVTCVSPVVVQKPQEECKEGELSIDVLSEEDYYTIIGEASSFMSGGKDPKSFPEKQPADNTGCDSEAVRSETVGVDGHTD